MERDFHLILGCNRDSNNLSVHATPKAQQQQLSSCPGDTANETEYASGRASVPGWESTESARFLYTAQANSRLVLSSSLAVAAPASVKEEELLYGGAFEELRSNQWAAALNSMGLEPFNDGHTSAMLTPPPPPPVPLGPLASAVPLRSVPSFSHPVSNERNTSGSSCSSSSSSSMNSVGSTLASAVSRGATCWLGEGAQGIIDWDHPLYSPACLAVDPAATAAALAAAAPVRKQRLACGALTVARGRGSSGTPTGINSLNNSSSSSGGSSRHHGSPPSSGERTFPAAVAAVASGTAPARGGRLLVSLPRADASVGLAGAAAALIVHQSEPPQPKHTAGGHLKGSTSSTSSSESNAEREDLSSGSSGRSDSDESDGDKEAHSDHRSQPTSPLSMVVVQLSAMGDVLATYWPARQDYEEKDEVGNSDGFEGSTNSGIGDSSGATEHNSRSTNTRPSRVQKGAPTPRFVPAKSVRQFREPLHIQPFKRLCVPVTMKSPTGAATSSNAAAASGELPSPTVGGVAVASSNLNAESSSSSTAAAESLAHRYGAKLVTWLKERPQTLGELQQRLQTLAPATAAASSSTHYNQSSSASSVEELARLLPQVLACVPSIGRTTATTLPRAPVRFVRANSSEETEGDTSPDFSDVYWLAS